jgi:hypothetical protein
MPDDIEHNLQRLTAITLAFKAADKEKKASQQRRQDLDEALRNLIRRDP